MNSNHAYGTHLPMLMEYALLTSGDILEVGAGEYSSPVLGVFAGLGRKVVTVEPDYKWHLDYKREAIVLTVEEALAYGPFDVVLWDGPIDRNLTPELIQHGRYWLLHDAEVPRTYGYDFSLFKYKRLYSVLRPWTFVGTNNPLSTDSNDYHYLP